jgi:hypothetical protein
MRIVGANARPLRLGTPVLNSGITFEAACANDHTNLIANSTWIGRILAV